MPDRSLRNLTTFSEIVSVRNTIGWLFMVRLHELIKFPILAWILGQYNLNYLALKAVILMVCA